MGTVIEFKKLEVKQGKDKEEHDKRKRYIKEMLERSARNARIIAELSKRISPGRSS